MWRASRNIKVKMGVCKDGNLTVKKSLHPFRSFSTPPSMESKSTGGSRKVFLSLFGVSALAAGGVTAYAKYDANFRESIEKAVPYSREAFGYLLGKSIEPPSKPSEPVPIKEKKIGEGLIRRSEAKENLAPEKKEKPLPSSKTASQSTPDKGLASPAIVASPLAESSPETPPSPAMVPVSKTEVPVPEKPNYGELQARIDRQEVETASKNRALEKTLQNLKDACNEAVKEAVENHNQAVEAIKKHINSLRAAMDDSKLESKEQQWKVVAEAQEVKNKAVEYASQKFIDAKNNLERLRDSIKDGKQSKITSSNAALLHAEEQLNKLFYEIESAASKVLASQSELKIVSDCKELIEEGRKQFQNELEKLIPDIKAGAQKNKKMTEEELNSLVALARLRIEQLQDKIAQLHLHERLRLQSALDSQRQQDDSLMQSRIRQELDKQRSTLDVDFQKRIANTKQEFEGELCQQLKRQAEAHRDHLADVLKVQHLELERKFQRRLEDEIQEENFKFNKQIASSISRLRAIESALEARAETERKARKAHELWLAVQSLEETLKYGQRNAVRWEDRLCPLTTEVKAIKAAGDNHPFINILIKSFPEEAANRGVFPEDVLKERFVKIKNVCRRVAMIDDNGGSLFLYALSYLQSLLIVDPKCNISNNDLIDHDKLNTFTILASVDYCLNKSDIGQAVRFMNQLRGEPRRVANNWLHEARLLLETRQVVDLLMAHVSATGVENIPHVQ